MTASESSGRDARTRRRRQARLAHLQADLAYFQARIEILGEPRTVNQRAQRRAFSTLYALFAKYIPRMKVDSDALQTRAWSQ